MYWEIQLNISCRCHGNGNDCSSAGSQVRETINNQIAFVLNFVSPCSYLRTTAFIMFGWHCRSKNVVFDRRHRQIHRHWHRHWHIHVRRHKHEHRHKHKYKHIHRHSHRQNVGVDTAIGTGIYKDISISIKIGISICRATTGKGCPEEYQKD